MWKICYRLLQFFSTEIIANYIIKSLEKHKKNTFRFDYAC